MLEAREMPHPTPTKGFLQPSPDTSILLPLSHSFCSHRTYIPWKWHHDDERVSWKVLQSLVVTGLIKIVQIFPFLHKGDWIHRTAGYTGGGGGGGGGGGEEASM